MAINATSSVVIAFPFGSVRDGVMCLGSWITRVRIGSARKSDSLDFHPRCGSRCRMWYMCVVEYVPGYKVNICLNINIVVLRFMINGINVIKMSSGMVYYDLKPNNT